VWDVFDRTSISTFTAITAQPNSEKGLPNNQPRTKVRAYSIGKENGVTPPVPDMPTKTSNIGCFKVKYETPISKIKPSKNTVCQTGLRPESNNSVWLSKRSSYDSNNPIAGLNLRRGVPGAASNGEQYKNGTPGRPDADALISTATNNRPVIDPMAEFINVSAILATHNVSTPNTEINTTNILTTIPRYSLMAITTYASASAIITGLLTARICHKRRRHNYLLYK
jgi:hypothetical protein